PLVDAVTSRSRLSILLRIWHIERSMGGGGMAWPRSGRGADRSGLFESQTRRCRARGSPSVELTYHAFANMNHHQSSTCRELRASIVSTLQVTVNRPLYASGDRAHGSRVTNRSRLPSRELSPNHLDVRAG